MGPKEIQLKAFVQKRHILLFGLIFISSRIELILGRQTYFHMKHIIFIIVFVDLHLFVYYNGHKTVVDFSFDYKHFFAFL